MSSHCSTTSSIAHSDNFENAVVIILDNRVDDLTEAERESVIDLKKPGVSDPATTPTGSSFAADLLKRRKIEKAT